MNELLHKTEKSIVTFSQEQIDVIKSQIAIGATDNELKSFIWQCERTGLDPFSRQIYFIKSGGKVQIQTSIDGFRLIAERSNKYEGQTPVQWCGQDGVWKDIWVHKDFPVAAKVGVFKRGFREPLYATAHWDEYFAQPGFMHKKMPALMIAKVAESLALRKAFPNEMSGLYTQEEMPAQKPHFMDGIKEAAEEEALRMSFDAPPSTVYRIPFGTHKHKGLHEVDIQTLERSTFLTQERIQANQPYTNSSIKEMQEFVDKVNEYVSKFENNASV